MQTYSRAYNPGFRPSWEGLCLESAAEATPRWYGVSSGNGNDGVSHTFPDYFVRTNDPWMLATCALLAEFKPEGYAWALETAEIDGEAEYTICATVYDPPGGDTRDHTYCEDGEDCEGCDACEPDESWSSVNGAWLIIEVFPVTENTRSAALRYEDGIPEAFSPDIVALATEA